MALIPKIVSCCTLFIVTFFFGVLSCGIVRLMKRRMPKSTSHQKYIGWMNCFAGGVFFGTTFLHLMPESIAEIKLGIDVKYPIAEILISAGFFIVLLLEHLFGLCFTFCSGTSLLGDKNKLFNEGKLKENEYEISELKTSPKPNTPAKNPEQRPINGHLGQTNCAYSSNDSETFPVVELTSSISDMNTHGVHIKSVDQPQITESTEVIDDGHVSSFTGRSFSEHEYEDIDGTENGSEEGKVSVFRITVLIIALSLHMVFEGLALGLQDTVPAVWTLLIVISVHKCIMAASVGLQLNDVMKKMKQIMLCLFFFSLVTPLGIVIGVLVNDLSSTENIVSAILECIATGSFLYVTFFEILQREFNEHHNMIKLLITFLGFCVSAGAKLLETYFHKD
ncbi:SLC39A1_2_3 [Mytilus coruscus]|uniref:SLC39A1_2_3 n=1 Tax=Mytilus coruscus TaxID=42192 RepID=A0A6J8BQ23_MYTCO|nr:SLC39A1_2_3 [Mytilus coruscus]